MKKRHVAKAACAAALLLMAACAARPPVNPVPEGGRAGRGARVYCDTGGAYRLVLPDEWPEGSFAFLPIPDFDLPFRYGGARRGIRILYLPVGGPGSGDPQLVGTLRVYDPAAWREAEPSHGPPLGMVVGVTEGAVLVASMVPGNPYPEESEDGPRYAALRDALPKLWKSLESRKESP